MITCQLLIQSLKFILSCQIRQNKNGALLHFTSRLLKLYHIRFYYGVFRDFQTSCNLIYYGSSILTKVEKIIQQGWGIILDWTVNLQLFYYTKIFLTFRKFCYNIHAVLINYKLITMQSY